MKTSTKLILIINLLLILIAVSPAQAQTPPAQPVVQAVLFWMDGCPHCHEVIDNVLPPLQTQYGDQLQISLIEVSSMDDIERLYEVAARYGIPKEQVGVPFLIIGEQVLIGSGQIPAELPELIEGYLSAGGVTLPEIPEFADILPAEVQAEEICAPAASCNDSSTVSAPLVESILFTTPDCHDCQLIAAQVTKLAREDFNGQFTVETVDIVTSEDVDYLYQITAQFGLTKDAVDLPLLILGEQILIAEEIPAHLPTLIETYLQVGGAAPAPLPTPEMKSDDAISEAVLPRPDGFWIAIATLVFLTAALIYSLIRLALTARHDSQPKSKPSWQGWAIPVLALVGLGVAGYLAYVETQMISAACGPVGDCNAVQSSPYARLFGVLPIGVLGMVGYLAILLSWAWGRFRRDALAGYAPLAVYGMSFAGVLFSAYLTYLEPFVIKAVCMWCISSALIMALLLLFSVNPVLQTFNLEEESREGLR